MGTSLSAAGKGTVSAKGQWLVWPWGQEVASGGDMRPPTKRAAAGQPEEPHRTGPGGAHPSQEVDELFQQCPQPFLIQLPTWRAAESLFTARGF